MIGRIKEQKALKEAYKSEYSQFVAVYGRRRIGKTFLVRETFEYNFTFQHAGAAKESMKGQLALFKTSLQDYGHKDCPELKTWHEAFNQLKVLIQSSKSKKKKIFLDEAAWMDTPKSNFLSALEHFWNNWASNRKDVLLIICASATSWIINKVFKNRGGLHNRVTVRIPLAPFTLNECEQFSKERGLKLSRYQILNLYMVMGGVALYWTMLDKQFSAVQNIDQLFFNKDAKLKGEFNDLYDSLFKHPDAYKSIVVTLGKHLSGLTRKELLKYTGQADNGVFSDRLEELEECGFIMKMRSFPKDKKELMRMIDDEVVKNGPTCSLNHIDVSEITDMSCVFRQSIFDGDITNWDVSNVKDMSFMFEYAEFTGQNSDLSQWDVSNVDLMNYMFDHSKFNNRKSLNGWRVKKTAQTRGMFISSPLADNEPYFYVV